MKDKEDIMDDLELIQIEIDRIGLVGNNERELWARDSMADYILKNFKEK